MDFLNSLEPLLRTFWYIAIPTSLIFLIQTIMTFVGVETADSLEADFDSDFGHSHEPFQIFSFRNLINFLIGFSWSGISFYKLIPNPFVLTTLAFIIGVSFVATFFLIIQQLRKFSENNSFQINNAVNQIGSVYLSIPEHKSGRGKVQISIKGSFHELDAITENGRIKTNETVRIVGIENNTLVVEKI